MSPISPSSFKALIPSGAGGLCTKFKNFLNFPNLFYQWFVSVYDESGEFTDEFKAQLCAAGCLGTGTGGGDGGGSSTGDLGIPVIAASDGLFNDKVQVTWAAVAGASSYTVFRNSVNDLNTAGSLGTTGGTSFDDATANAGTTYYYWVKATDGTNMSTSGSDTGYRSAELTTVSDLECSQGLSEVINGGSLSLVFSKVVGATGYDIYRNSSNDFSTAAKIDSNRSPYDNARSITLCGQNQCPKPIFTDNGLDLTYFDVPPNPYSKFYYWVKAIKADAGGTIATTTESNVGIGWTVGDGSGRTPQTIISAANLTTPFEYTVPAFSASKAWIVLHGNGGGGAGANGTYGGGGGGGNAVAAGKLSVVAGKKVKFVGMTTVAAGAADSSDGNDGIASKIQYDGTGSFVDQLTCSGGTKGLFNAGGAGPGGAGATAANPGGVEDPVLHDGKAGLAAVGNVGGRGGHAFGRWRSPASHLNNDINNVSSGLGLNGTNGGGGSDAVGFGLGTSAGAQHGFAFVVFYS